MELIAVEDERSTAVRRKLVRLQLRDGRRQVGDSVAFIIVALMIPLLSAQMEQEGFSPSQPHISC